MSKDGNFDQVWKDLSRRPAPLDLSRPAFDWEDSGANLRAITNQLEAERMSWNERQAQDQAMKAKQEAEYTRGCNPMAPSDQMSPGAGGMLAMPIEQRLEELFKHHPPNSDMKIIAHEELRIAGLTFAKAILRFVPTGADRSDAIRKVREALMTANAGVANEGMNL